MASFFRSAPRTLSRLAAQQPLAARSRAAPFLFKRGFASLPAEQPRLRLGSIAPDFKANTTHGEIEFHKWIGDSWAILFSHPADFTPVCTTELGAFAKLKDEFEHRGVKMIGLSANDIGSHGKWIEDINEISNTNLSFPIIGDADRNVAFLYDMITQDDLDNAGRDVAFTIRSVFIIDPSKKIRLTMMYPASTGRNSMEVLRVIDSLQLGDAQKITTPIDWQVGDDVIVPPSVSTADAKKRFGESNVREVKPYLRFVPDPQSGTNDKVSKPANPSNAIEIYAKAGSKKFELIGTFVSARHAAKCLNMSLKAVQKYKMSGALYNDIYRIRAARHKLK